MATATMPREVWRHPAPETTEMDRFRRDVNKKRRLNLKTYQDLHNYSIEGTEFWEDVWVDSKLIYDGKYTSVVDFSQRMDSNPKWFQGIHINHAENILFTPSPTDPSVRTTRHKEDKKIAITEIREGGTELQHTTWGEFRKQVGQMASAMRSLGVKKGDRIACCAANQRVTLVVFLATSSIGAIFTSSATDMGVKGVLDRLTQVEPTYLFMDDWALWNGVKVDLRNNLKQIVNGMKGAKGWKGAVILPRFGPGAGLAGFEGVSKVQTLASFLKYASSDELVFERVNFGDPLGILYSSGTTGQPKCIVHQVGGILLMAYTQQVLHHSNNENGVLLQFTTTGWIMFYFCVNILLQGARTVLYDGSPFKNHPLDFIKLWAEQKVTQLGISPRYMQELQNLKINPRDLVDLSSLKIVTSTGMVLSDAQFEWFYDEAFPKHTHLANITGGTDVAAAFALGNPLTPVYVGGCQGLGLGFKMEVFDSTIGEEGGPTVKGRPVPHGVSGELVCTRPFPTMPITFWGPNGHTKYHNSYFAKYDDVWTHGDFVEHHPITHALLMQGRSDGVLNPSGIRFGSSEIYSILESQFPHIILDSIVIGQRRPRDTDESVILFLHLRPGQKFTTALIGQVKGAIAKGLSKRHVPKYVFETTWGIPATINFKKVELPVKKIVSGERVTPSSTIANPECLQKYYEFVEVEERQRELEVALGISQAKL